MVGASFIGVALPRFYFHILSATSRHPDTAGLEFPDTEGAFLEAHRAAREMAAEISASGGDPYEYKLVIHADGDFTPVELPFAEVLPARLPLAFGLNDASGRFLDVDEAFCSILGRARAELVRLDILAVTAKVDHGRNKANLDDLLATGRTFNIRKRYRRDDGSAVWVENQVSLFRDGLGPPRIIAGCRMLSPAETVWEAHDKAAGIARPATEEGLQAAQWQAVYRARVASQLKRQGCLREV